MIVIGQTSNLPAGHPFYSFISVQKNDLTMIVLLASIALAVGIFVWGIVVSHSISGPLYHLKKYMDEANSETVKTRPLNFRKDDFFQELPESFNKFVKKIVEK
jgi:methyl-accepting chemotaxis protein